MLDTSQFSEDLTHEEIEVLKRALGKIIKSDGRSFTATEIGKELGISAKRVGIIAKKHGIQTNTNSEYCFWSETVITHDKNGKVRKQFSTPVCRYTNKGREEIIKLFHGKKL